MSTRHHSAGTTVRSGQFAQRASPAAASPAPRRFPVASIIGLANPVPNRNYEGQLIFATRRGRIERRGRHKNGVICMRNKTAVNSASNRLGSFLIRGATLISTLAISVPPVLAQTPPTTLTVETFIVPPFAMEQDGALTGFSIDIWKEIAGRLRVQSNYQIAPDVAAGFDALRSKKADLAVSGVFITAERDKEFDFSYPILEAGQQVMVLDAGDTVGQNPLLGFLSLLFSKTTLVWLVIGVLFVLIPAHLIWMFERRSEDGILPTEKYIPGIFHAAYWSATALLAQAEQMPRQPIARVLMLLWLFTSIVFVALYTAQLTANLTVEQIRGAINGPEDLPGKRVGTIKGSATIDYLRGRNARVQEFAQMGDMYQALLDKKVDALLFAAPVLRYYAAHEGKGLVKMVGPEFNKRDLGIVFPDGSPRRRQVNSALVAIQEDGTYQRLYDKWFGSE
jgi:polar amino acid transport system substrate-binding protein